MRYKGIRVISILLLAVFLLTGCQIGDTKYVWKKEIIDNNTLFCVNDYNCDVKVARLYLANYKNLYGTSYGVDLWGQESFREDLAAYVKDVSLLELSRVVCMDLLAKERGISLTEEEMECVKEAAEEYHASLKQDEKKYIGMSKSDLERCYEQYALAKKLYQTLTVGVNAEVSDDEARVIRIQQIFVEEESVAQIVEKKLQDGEDFAVVSSAYNRAESVEAIIARGDLPEDVEAIAYNLENDAISSKIKVDGGYYFIKCLNKFEEELTEANKANIVIKREKEQFNDVYDEFVSRSEFTFNEKAWKNLKLEKDVNIETDSFFRTYDQKLQEE